MKKIIIKIAVFMATFLVSLIVIGQFMNKGHDNITMEMADATFPVIVMEKNGVSYNALYGYKNAMDTALLRDTVTVLGQNRNTDFIVQTFGKAVTGISIEVRSIDGNRLIENTELTGYEADGANIRGTLALKDLLEKDTEYMLTFLLRTEGEEVLHYYTRVIWSDNLYADEEIAFVTDFHNRLYDREKARELTKYLETNASLQDNQSFHYVNIHSSFRQITWGDLPVREETAPQIRLTEIAPQTAALLMDYVVSTTEGKNKTYYQIREYYRLRYTPDRMYLLNYERNMVQIPDTERMYANDKILLGITGEDVSMVESEDGNVVVFQAAGQLLSYNVLTNKLAVIFSFYDKDNADIRTMLNNHTIKIFDVDEGGNVRFAVYGYMNRGRHEGEVGIQLYTYDNALNTIEEMIYIPCNCSYAVLEAEMQNLLYLSREQKLYFSLGGKIYCANLVERTYFELFDITEDDNIYASENHRILVSLWSDGEGSLEDADYRTKMMIQNLNTETQEIISAGAGEAIRPLGFMGEDVIYGLARIEDIVRESSGNIFFPMYKIYISNAEGEMLKEYQQSGVYIMDCHVQENQIILERQQRLENGSYVAIEQDQIMNNLEGSVGKNQLASADIDIYEKYVQIKLRSSIDTKNIKVVRPKEVVFEGGRELLLSGGNETARYYVYGPYGVNAIYNSPAAAVNLAYQISGIVTDDSGNCIWLKGNRVTRNQIMAIKEDIVTPSKDSLTICLDTMLKFEGIIRNSEYLLGRGDTVREILENNLEGAQILDLTGCNLDAVLYYVNQDIPVLALLKNKEAVLVTGFNEYNVVIMEPATGTLYKKGMNDATQWFEENGNQFITYIRTDA
ncbi:MAG: hypothetical protein NC251_08585 [Lachnoclostridium sp.]|nr:hypothetical protein [Lachnospira sp.]MCM1248471.1 hypothetical protein [Lachnoclostridium sp.]MCM1535971.1 hypothetical protein [Clostridium sp.]